MLRTKTFSKALLVDKKIAVKEISQLFEYTFPEKSRDFLYGQQKTMHSH